MNFLQCACFVSCHDCSQELFKLCYFHSFVFFPCSMPMQESPLSLCVSSFPLHALHVDVSIGYIFFICFYGCVLLQVFLCLCCVMQELLHCIIVILFVFVLCKM